MPNFRSMFGLHNKYTISNICYVKQFYNIIGKKNPRLNSLEYVIILKFDATVKWKWMTQNAPENTLKNTISTRHLYIRVWAIRWFFEILFASECRFSCVFNQLDQKNMNRIANLATRHELLIIQHHFSSQVRRK